MTGVEGDVEMMVAGKAVFGDLEKGLADDGAMRIFDHLIVLQQAVRHVLSCGSNLVKWGASVARCPPNRAYLMLGSECDLIIVRN